MPNVNEKSDSVLNKRAYNNIMGYLRDSRLHDVKYGQMTDRIYLLTESNIKKLEEIRRELNEKLAAYQKAIDTIQPAEPKYAKESEPQAVQPGKTPEISENSADTRELLKRTETLQRQMRELLSLLRNMSELQAEVNAKATANVQSLPTAIPVEGSEITYEEFKELKESWEQFAKRMESQFEHAETMTGEIHTDIQNVKSAAINVQMDMEDIKSASENMHANVLDVKAAAVNMQTDIADVLSMTEEFHSDFMRAGATTEGSLQRISEQLDAYEQEVKDELVSLRQILSDGSATANSQDEMSFASVSSIAASLQMELDGFRGSLAQAVRNELAEYNTNVKNMSMTSQQVFEDSLENHERIIKREISLVQEMVDNTLEDQLQKTIEEINNVKKTTKNYARVTMWISGFTLIILFVDIFIFSGFFN